MTRRTAANALAAALVAIVLGWQVMSLGSTLAIDGHLADAGSYQAAVVRWLGGDSPYSPAQLSGPHTLGNAVGGVGFVYPPVALPLFLPLALGVEATLLWVLLTHAAFAVSVFAIARAELMVLPVAASMAVVAAALALPGMNEIRFGNASALIATLIAVMWLSPRYGPIFAMVAGAIKVFPLAGVPWSLRWGGAWRSAAGVGALLVVVSLAIGPQYWVHWVTAMASAVPSCPDWALPSVACATGSGVPGLALGGLLLVGALLAPDRAVGFFLLTVAMITPAPDLYQHYLLVPFVGAVPLACRVAVRVWVFLGGERPATAAAVAS